MNVWEERHQAGDTPWDRGIPHPALERWLVDNKLPGPVMVPGFGMGHDVRAISATGVDVVGVDIAPTAVAKAEAFAKAGSERYVVGSVFSPPAEWAGAFGAVFEHTCFCAIDPADRGRYAEGVARVLQPGGLLVAVFFLDPGVEQGPPFGCTLEELEQVFAERFLFRSVEKEIPTYPGREGEEVFAVLERRTS